MILNVTGKVLSIDEKMSQNGKIYAYIRIREAYQHYELNIVAFNEQVPFFEKGFFVRMICALRANEFNGTNSLIIVCFIDKNRTLKKLRDYPETDDFNDYEDEEG